MTQRQEPSSPEVPLKYVLITFGIIGYVLLGLCVGTFYSRLVGFVMLAPLGAFGFYKMFTSINPEQAEQINEALKKQEATLMGKAHKFLGWVLTLIWIIIVLYWIVNKIL